jgi:hypothetical protein
MIIPMMILNGVKPTLRTLEWASRRIRDATKFSEMNKVKESLVTVVISVEGEENPHVALMTKDGAASIFEIPAVRDGVALVGALNDIDSMKRSVGMG